MLTSNTLMNISHWSYLLLFISPVLDKILAAFRFYGESSKL